ncbi:arylalkylamine N-acetyltransferase-like 2 [Ochlerotatus camptorhynchus]|uniref:arylalkylamine N-acetyltransferase-like 2 n=1 Tax=Ochlerotatus camptorhynchus TaxID=644619 RepID=UPI0031D2C2D6
MSTKVDGIEFRQAISADREAYREALARFFYPEEPLTIGYYLGKDVTEDDMEFTLSLIEEGFVWLAVQEGSGKIIGMCGGSFIERGEADQLMDAAERTETKKFADILRLLAHLSREANVFERFGVDRAYHVHCLAVDSGFRGKSLGRILVEKQFEYARKCAIRVVSADATSVYSVKLLERLGMESCYALTYADYRDEHEQQVFLTDGPHSEAKTMVKVL